MGKQKTQVKPAPKIEKRKKRTRRFSAYERKSLTKASKWLFRDASREVRRLVLAAERTAKGRRFAPVSSA